MSGPEFDTLLMAQIFVNAEEKGNCCPSFRNTRTQTLHLSLHNTQSSIMCYLLFIVFARSHVLCNVFYTAAFNSQEFK